MNKILKTAFLGVFATLTSSMPLQAASCDDYCCPTDFSSCNECCDRFWGSAEYLYWKIQDAPQSTPLVIESPVSDAVLGDPDTNVVLGSKKIKNDWVSGGRFALGYWFDECRTFGAEVNYFILPYQSKKHSVFGSGLEGSNYLAVPYFNTDSGSEDSFGIAGFYDDEFGPYSGKATLKLRNRMQGAELNAVMLIPTCDCNFKVGVLAGFRWWNFDENLSFETDSPYLNYAGDVWVTKDKFDSQNNFYGGQIGVGVDYNCGCFFFNLKGKLALGANCAKTKVSGSLLTNDYNEGFPPAISDPVEYEGGIFAQSTNIGSRKKTYFAVIPEVNANIGYQITECLRIKAGYTFLYVNKVLRPGSQIDRNINPTQSVTLDGPGAVLVGDPTPRTLTKTNSIWAQGVSVGFDFSF